jgi:putative addiction module component (TIGR02574 family)
MSAAYERIEREARALDPHEKATLARTLIEDLDSTVDRDVEAVWVAEAERRYESYKAGKEQAVPGDEAMERARKALR